MKKNIVGKRIIAAVIDLFICTFLNIALMFIMLKLKGKLTQGVTMGEMNEIFNLAYIITMIIFFGKDVINGRSVGKRLMKIRVVCKEGTTKVQGIIKLFLRNLLFFLWPIDLALILIREDQLKIADRLFGTQVIPD